jgi:limonene-1,2-epoxide hydrolase
MTTNTDTSVSRRALLASAGIGGMAACMLPPAMAATGAGTTPAEKANIELVRHFILGWTKKDYDANKEMATYLSSPCLVRPVEDKPALTAPAEAAKVFIDFMKDGSRVGRVDFDRVMATGPLVVTRRKDIVLVPGKPNVVYDVAGVFLVKDGKIREWIDYIVT